MKMTLFTVLGLVMVGVPTSAAIISNVSKTGGNAEVPVVVPLADGSVPYTDRTFTLLNIPAEFEADAELIQLSNSDKESTPLQHDVTVDTLTVLYVGLDDRLNEGVGQPLAWMNDPNVTGLPTAFFDTGRQIDVDEDGDGASNNTFSLWATIAPGGTYSLFDQNDGGGRNMYIAFADNKLISEIPEPASLTLIGAGLIGLAMCGRRRR